MASIQVDGDALGALREVLVDTDATAFTYPNSRLIQALQDNREIALFRNPLATGVFANVYALNLIYGRGRTPTNKSNTVECHLQPEPGLRNFQALRHCRHWDSNAPAMIYRMGLLSTVTTDYTVDYHQGRVTFTTDVQDYEPVMASFAYYRVYHAAKDAILWRMGRGDRLVSWKDADAAENYGPVNQALVAIDAAIANMTPQEVRFGARIY